MKQTTIEKIFVTKRLQLHKHLFGLLLLPNVLFAPQLFAGGSNNFFHEHSGPSTNNPGFIKNKLVNGPPVHGKIFDGANGQPVAGVTIKIKGTQTGTTTDVNGDFTIQAPDNAVLVITYVGYEPIEEPVKGRVNMNIRISASNKNLGEVIVVGYGTQKKISTTAAVSTVNPTEFAEKPVVNLTNSLVGRASGLIITQGSGEPGFDASNILIRGVGTIGGYTNPLLIVDGVPRDFSRLDPNTIESFTVLKDAAAVAPYGVAGANGVILITTKQGKTGKPTLSYNGYYGVQNPTRVPVFANSLQYAQLRNEAALNDFSPNGAPYSAYDLEKFKDHSDPDGHPDAAPLKEIIQSNRPITYHNLSLAGGTEDIHYYAALAYTHQNGMWAPTYLDKYNGILNVTAKATRTTTVSISANSYQEDQHFPAVGAGSIIDQAMRQAPTTPVLYSNGLNADYIGQSLWGEIYKSGYNTNQNSALLTQLSINQKLPVKGLEVKATVSYDNGPDPIFTGDQSTISRKWATPIEFYNVDTNTHPYTYNSGFQGNPKASFSETYSRNVALTYQGQINYAGSFGKSDIVATGVIEDRTVKYETFTAQRINYNLSIDELNFGGPAPADATNGGSSSGQKQLGYVYRVDYSYDKKYGFSAAGRYDGNWLFAPGHRFGFFPSFSARWNISQEEFMKNVTWVDNLKLRGSWGVSGAYPSQGGAIKTYQYLSPYNVYGNSAVIGGSATQGVYEALQGNPNITWEKGNKSDVGLEASLWKGLLGVEIDYFYEKRSNMLIPPVGSLPSEYGVGLGLVNGGIMSNHGIDMTLTTATTFSNGLRLDVKGTFTYAKNKLLQVSETQATYNNPNRRQTGRPYGEQFGLIALGYYTNADFVDPTIVTPVLKPGLPVPTYGTVRPGDIKYADLSGPNGKPDGKIDVNDNTDIGPSSTPQIIYGIEPRISYKGFDLDVLFQGAGNVGQQLNNYFVWPFQSSGSVTKLVYLDHWTPTHPSGLYPRISGTPTQNNIQASSWWERNTTYLRMRSVEVGYTFSSRMMGNSIHSLRLYLAGNNIFTYTPRIKEMYDPENSANDENYFQQRVISFGINATF